jgi:hypothetical protein
VYRNGNLFTGFISRCDDATRQMAESIAQRIFLAHLQLSYRLGRKVTQSELGELVAGAMERDAPFTAAAVSRWESGAKVPSPEIIEAIAQVTETDPGWISHGERSAAPRPRGTAPKAMTPTGGVRSVRKRA